MNAARGHRLGTLHLRSVTRRTPLWLMLLFTFTYVSAGRLGLNLAFVNESASAVWPPTGIALAGLLILGFHIWPAVFVGAFIVNYGTSGAIVASLAIAAGNTAEGVLGAYLTRRFAHGAAAFDRAPDLLRFTFLAAMCATSVAASVGVLTLVVSGLAEAADISSIWFTWWLGDAVGATVVTPLLVLWTRRSATRWSSDKVLEAGMLGTLLALVSAVVFTSSPLATANQPVAFLVAPPLLSIAFRFGGREIATASTVVTAIAISGTLRGRGPFASGSPNEALLLVQAFIGVMTTMMLSVAAEVRRRRHIEQEMRSVNDALEHRVSERTAELLKVQDRLVEAQRVAHVGSWEWDVTANALWWSDELCRIYGVRDQSEVQGYDGFLAHVHPDDRSWVDDRVRRAMADGQPFAFEHRIVRPDGDVRVLAAAGRIVLDEHTRPIRMMGIGHDITELKAAEEERVQLIHEQAARHEAEEMNRKKDEFLAVLSHELRTPLNVALGWAHILPQLPPNDPRVARAADAIYRNLVIQSRLVADILDVSRIAKGTLVLDRAPIELHSAVESAIDMVREAASARSTTIHNDVPPVGITLEADAKRLQQVFWNLLSNAVKFGKDGGHVRVFATLTERCVEVTVSDDGPGIAPEFLPYMFEQFSQADPTPTRRHDGLGLGLAIAKHIVEQHGGTIAARNLDGGGAAFTIRLRVTAAAAV